MPWFGLRPGAVWTEAEQGTNGMGTCLVEGAAVLVERQQHFLRQNAVLSCCAMPILDGTGAIAGSLNASGLGQLSGGATIALLELVARNIEHRALLETYRHTHLLLQLHVQRELVFTNAAGILVIDGAGTVVASNRAALTRFGIDRHADICGQRLADLLSVDCSLLTTDRRGSAESPRLLRNGLYGAWIQSPLAWEAPRECQERVDEMNLLREAERDTLKHVLDRHGDNVSRAAADLGISRRTLHRKILRYGLQRERSSTAPRPHSVLSDTGRLVKG
jgi:transcriptional regulator of acetoin/glycerol metabolism